MKFLLSHHLIFLLFALVPLILHLLKRQLSSKLELSSLVLLRNRKKRLRESLKLHQLLLLLARMGLVFFLALFFLQILYLNAPNHVADLFPFEDRATVLLDTNHDRREDLLETFYSVHPHAKNLQLTIEELGKKDLLDTLVNRGGVKGEQVYLVSRFYGLNRTDLKSITRLKYELIPHGPQRVDNSGIYQMKAEPEMPFLGEEVRFSGVVASNLESGGEIDLKFSSPVSNMERKLPLNNLNSTGFEFFERFHVPGSQLVKLNLPEDEFSGDDLEQIRIIPRDHFRVLILDDRDSKAVSIRKTYYIEQFLKHFFSGLPTVDFLLETAKSSNRELLSKSWDWVIFSDLKEQAWPENAANILVFPQTDPDIRRFLDEKIGMRSYEFESDRRAIHFQSLNVEDQVLLDQSLHLQHSLQMSVKGAQNLIMAGKDQVLCKKNQIYISSFHWHDLDFDGIFHPYFPVFMYRFFLQRPGNIAKSREFEAKSFEREKEYFEREFKPGVKGAVADLSPLFLLLFLFFLLFESFLIFRMERILGRRT